MTTYTLNILDLLLTLHALNNGATELNPLMQSVPLMVAWKVIGVGVLCWSLGHITKGGNMVARWGLKFLTAVYTAVNLYHIYFILGG